MRYEALAAVLILCAGAAASADEAKAEKKPVEKATLEDLRKQMSQDRIRKAIRDYVYDEKAKEVRIDLKVVGLTTLAEQVDLTTLAQTIRYDAATTTFQLPLKSGAAVSDQVKAEFLKLLQNLCVQVGILDPGGRQVSPYDFTKWSADVRIEALVAKPGNGTVTYRVIIIPCEAVIHPAPVVVWHCPPPVRIVACPPPARIVACPNRVTFHPAPRVTWYAPVVIRRPVCPHP